MIDLDSPLDLMDPAVTALLEGVQGNILKGHGRDHSAQLVITLGANAGEARRWAARIAAELLTSAAHQAEQTRRHHTAGGPGEPFAGLVISMDGYAALDVDPTLLPADPFFAVGMKRHNEVGSDPINDPPPPEWEPGWQDAIHAMLLLADDDRGRLEVQVAAALAGLEAIGARCFVERGEKLRFDFGHPRGTLEIEHFGFQDGISNPQMILADVEKERRERGYDRWDPAAGASLVLTPEPGGTGYGSYFVFRKLEQHVSRFQAAIAGLADELGVSPDKAGALAIGRHKDGTPVIATDVLVEGVDPNNFNFADDRPDAPAAARLCPFHAHIRRSNPRGDLPKYLGASFEFERSMRIARRGITYGARPDLAGDGDAPDHGVGLLFMCCQASLRQFAIQQAGSDSEGFPFGGAGLEGLTGRPTAGAEVEPQIWPIEGGGANETRRHLLRGSVTMLGGEYFFAPSLGFLRSLDLSRR